MLPVDIISRRANKRLNMTYKGRHRITFKAVWKHLLAYFTRKNVLFLFLCKLNYVHCNCLQAYSSFEWFLIIFHPNSKGGKLTYCRVNSFFKLPVWVHVFVQTRESDKIYRKKIQSISVTKWSFRHHSSGWAKSRVVWRGQQSNRQMSAPPLVFQGNIAQTHPTEDK